jgi:serine protease AprX
VGVAVIDSGIFPDRDLTTEPGKPFSRVVAAVNFSSDRLKTDDDYGHGTHVAGIIGGNGFASGGIYMGIAPKADLINLKIMDENGMAYESDTVEAMQWVLEHRDAYNIRVVNLSVQSGAESSYHASPLDAAAEILWFNKIVVVAAAGNRADDGPNPIYAAPANDPFIITVGATDEMGTAVRSDDTVATFSASGETNDSFFKPELTAPGVDIVSVLSYQSTWDEEHPDRVVLNGEYFRLSGTSMAAPMVTGAVALLLQDEPDLTPDQVKYRLLSAASSADGAHGYLDVYAAVTGTTTEAANMGIAASQLLWSGDNPVQWDSVNWGSVNWGSVNWGSVNWGAVNWGSVNWGAVNWGR